MTEIIEETTPRPTLLDALVTRMDGYINEFLNLGGSKDASAYTRAESRGIGLTDAALSAMYAEDEWARKIVNLVVKHGLRSGWDIKLPGDPQEVADQRKAYLDREVEIGVPLALAQGNRWARLYGGAVTWVGVDDGKGDAAFLDRQKEPLDIDAIARVRFLRTYDRREVAIEAAYADALSPRFHRPALYKITPTFSGPRQHETDPLLARSMPGGISVHESRLIVWPGAETDPRRKSDRQGWDDSVLEVAWIALRSAAEDYGAKSQLLNRISQFIFKLKGLGAMIVSDERKLNRRLDLLNTQRQRGKALVMDTEESAEQITQPITGIDGALDKSVERVAIAGDTPPSIFIGRPTENDLKMWDEEVEAWQRDVLLPRHERLALLILRSKDGPTKGVEPKTWDIEYRPLHQPSRKERAELRKLQAETDAIEVEKAIITAADVALHRHTSVSSGEGEVMLNPDGVKATIDRQNDLAKQPPKDNAELGTVGARASAAMDVVTKVVQGQISPATATAIFTQFFRLTPDQATEMLGPKDFVPAPQGPEKPGPASAPPVGEGAGAPQGLKDFDDGGNPRTKALPPEGTR